MAFSCQAPVCMATISWMSRSFTSSALSSSLLAWDSASSKRHNYAFQTLGPPSTY